MLLEEKYTDVDMNILLTQAYQLADMVNHSVQVATYMYWKQHLETHEEVQQLIHDFLNKKECLQEAERFGHFHPNYHDIKNEIRAVQKKLDAIDAVYHFKQAEEALDLLLYQLSIKIAHAVSVTIKVPSNRPQLGGCGGGTCSGGCSGCS